MRSTSFDPRGSPQSGIQFHGKAFDDRYLNHRAEMWMKMAEWVKTGGVLPNEPVRELTAPTYTYVKGKFQLEPKDLTKQRIGVSPDLADGLALTFALPEMAKVTHPWNENEPQEQGKLKAEWVLIRRTDAN